MLISPPFVASDAGLRLARVAKFYALRPSVLMGEALSEHEAYCVDEALALRLNAVEAAEAREPVRAAPLAGGMFLPGPEL